MKAAIDVHYETDRSIAACVIFKEWQDSIPCDFKRIVLPRAREYYPGRFYIRELPCILAVVERTEYPLDTIIIDGYVHLKKGKGLGMYLFESLTYRPSVIGVAKSPLKIADHFMPITRGKSRRPLFISSIGCPVEYAASSIASMHGDFRVPTILKLADNLARGVFDSFS